MKHGLWRFVTGGHQAVMVFFCLSGYVLFQSMSGRALIYRHFLTRRICRIYLPYLFAVTLAFLAAWADGNASTRLLGPDFANVWAGGLTIKDYLWHASMILPFDNNRVIPVLWSLVYEMRISIFFPLLALGVSRLGARVMLPLACCASVLVCGSLHIQHIELGAAVRHGSLIATLHYSLMFVAGAVLAKHQASLNRWLADARVYTGVLTFGIFCYVLGSQSSLMHDPSLVEPLLDWISLLAAACLITITAYPGRLTTQLERQPYLSLGAVSYSLYLTHMIALIIIMRVLHGICSFAATAVVGLICIMLLAYLSYRFVERPSMWLGKRITS